MEQSTARQQIYQASDRGTRTIRWELVELSSPRLVQSSPQRAAVEAERTGRELNGWNDLLAIPFRNKLRRQGKGAYYSCLEFSTELAE